MIFVFLFIYAGFGVFLAEKYWVASEGSKVEISVQQVKKQKNASQLVFTDGQIQPDIYGQRKFCGHGGAAKNVARLCELFCISLCTKRFS